jgi:long-subunit acyl-CoA synthetase (AMP-forming)
MKLDRVKNQGCDTLWKCFKRSVWMYPNQPFLGVRTKVTEQFMGLPQQQTKADQLGEYNWKTWQEIDDYVEAVSRSFVKKGFCPVVKSEVPGTPDLKFMGIFSENRPEWIISELAACSDSVVIVPLAVEQ